MIESQSIHPGVSGGRRVSSISKTSAPHKGKGKLARKMAKLAARRIDHSQTLDNIRRSQSSSNPAGYRTPGSMNQHK